MNNSQIEPEEAVAALADIDHMQTVAGGISEESRWTKVAVALIAGGLVATTMAENSGTYVAILLAALVGVLSSERQRTGTSARSHSHTRSGRIALFGVILLAVALYAGGIVLRDLAGWSWGPLLAGAVLAATLIGVTWGTASEDQ